MLAVNVILKIQVQKRTFTVINKSIVVKLQRTLVKFVTVNTKRPGVNVTKFIKLRTMKEVIVNMDQKSQIKLHNLRKFQQVLFTKAKPIQKLCIAVNESMTNSKEPWQKLLVLILSQVG